MYPPLPPHMPKLAAPGAVDRQMAARVAGHEPQKSKKSFSDWLVGREPWEVHMHDPIPFSEWFTKYVSVLRVR